MEGENDSRWQVPGHGLHRDVEDRVGQLRIRSSSAPTASWGVSGSASDWSGVHMHMLRPEVHRAAHGRMTSLAQSSTSAVRFPSE